MSGHSIQRTSPKGGPFIGTCSLCGKAGLSLSYIDESCENIRGLTEGEALLEAIDPTIFVSNPLPKAERLPIDKTKFKHHI